MKVRPSVTEMRYREPRVAVSWSMAERAVVEGGEGDVGEGGRGGGGGGEDGEELMSIMIQTFPCMVLVGFGNSARLGMSGDKLAGNACLSKIYSTRIGVIYRILFT